MKENYMQLELHCKTNDCNRGPITYHFIQKKLRLDIVVSLSNILRFELLSYKQEKLFSYTFVHQTIVFITIEPKIIATMSLHSNLC